MYEMIDILMTLLEDIDARTCTRNARGLIFPVEQYRGLTDLDDIERLFEQDVLSYAELIDARNKVASKICDIGIAEQ